MESKVQSVICLHTQYDYMTSENKEKRVIFKRELSLPFVSHTLSDVQSS